MWPEVSSYELCMCGLMWPGVGWCGLVWVGLVWCELVWSGVGWCGLVRKTVQPFLLSRLDIVNWIAEGIYDLKNHPDAIEDSFHVCGIIKNDPRKVRNDEFFKKIMNSVKNKLTDEEEELLEDEEYFSMLYCLNSNFSISCSLVFFLI